jgi:hypothetical protein
MDGVLAGDPGARAPRPATISEFVHSSLRTFDEDEARRAAPRVSPSHG